MGDSWVIPSVTSLTDRSVCSSFFYFKKNRQVSSVGSQPLLSLKIINVFLRQKKDQNQQQKKLAPKFFSRNPPNEPVIYC